MEVTEAINSQWTLTRVLSASSKSAACDLMEAVGDETLDEGVV